MTLQYRDDNNQLIYKECGPPAGQLLGCCLDCEALDCTECPDTYSVTISGYPGPDLNGTFTLSRTPGVGTCFWSYIFPDVDPTRWILRLEATTNPCIWRLYGMSGNGWWDFWGYYNYGFFVWELPRMTQCDGPNTYSGYSVGVRWDGSYGWFPGGVGIVT